jgi:hypothetical protein
VSSLAGVVELAQGATEGLDLVFVGILLALGQLEGLEHFLHLVECLAQGLEGLIDLLDGPLDGRRRSRLKWPGSGGRRIWPLLGRSRPVSGLRPFSRLKGGRAFRLCRTLGTGGGFGSFAELRLAGRLGFFNWLKFLDPLGPLRPFRFFRSWAFSFSFFRFFIRDGGFGRIILRFSRRFARRRRFGGRRRFCRRAGELRRRRLGFALGRQRGFDPGWWPRSSAPAASVA